MKVLYVTPFYSSSLDGRFGRFTDWSHHLRDTEDPPFEYGITASTVTGVDKGILSVPYHLFGNGDELWGNSKNKLEYLANTPRIIRDISTFDPDIVHVMTLDSILFPIAKICKGKNTPLVIGPDVQGYFPGREGDRWNRSGLGHLRNQMTYRFRQVLSRLAPAAHYIALSDYHKRNIHTLVESDNVTKIRPGVDSQFCPSEDQSSGSQPFRTLYVGDLSEYKGYPLFLNALADLRSEISISATVLGTGNPRNEMIQRLGLEDTLNVEGFVERDELPQFYREADLFVMPSVDENGPNTIVESLACGTPVAVTDKPGINEYHPEGAGVTFDRNVSSLRGAILEAVENRETMRSIAREHAGEFNASRTVSSLRTVYDSMID